MSTATVQIKDEISMVLKNVPWDFGVARKVFMPISHLTYSYANNQTWFISVYMI